MSPNPNPKKLQALVDPSQLQEKFGGTLPNLTKFWPPTFPPLAENPTDEVQVVSVDEYPEFI